MEKMKQFFRNIKASYQQNPAHWHHMAVVLAVGVVLGWLTSGMFYG